jgi:integration host factor subunit beta
MRKRDIVRVIAKRVGLSQEKTGEIVQATLDEISNAVVRDGRIELRDFGVFECRRRKPRWGQNPKTHRPVFIHSRKTVKFTPGFNVEKRINPED